MSPEQAEQVRVLGQAVGAMVGGLSGAGISGVTLDMGIAKNSVENNYLNHDERMEYLQATLMCSDSGKDCDIKENFERLSAERDYKLLMACQVPGSIACSEQRSLAKIALESHNSPIYKGEYDAWMAENADKLIAASKKAGSGVSLDALAIHSSTEDLQRKIYCSLVGECGSNTVDLLRGAGYGAEADWLSSTNRAVAGAAFVNGLWTGGKDLVAGAASMNQIGVLLGLVSDYKEMDKLGLQAFSQKRNSAISQAINEYMEKTAGLAYYLAGGRNSWNFEDVDQAANVGGKLTVDIGSSLLGPEAFLAKGAKTTALEAAASEALERARKARSVKLEPDGSLPPHLLPDNIDGHGLIEHPVLQVPDSSMVAAERLKSDLFELQKVDVRLNTMLPGGGKPIEVIAESSIGGQVLWDTNQGSRPAHLADPNRPTLISDLVPPGRPNLNMKEAHAEIALIQQAFDAGLTRGQDMSMVVRGRSVCDFCMPDIGKAADRAGLNSVRVLDASNGRVHVWVRGIGWK